MATKVPHSDWREDRWNRYGELLSQEIISYAESGEFFSVTEIADNCASIEHLSNRNRYDIAIAICREMEERDMLRRQARLYYLPRKRRAA